MKKEVSQQIPVKSSVLREYFENLHSNKLKNLQEMDTFLHTFDLPKLNQEDINYLTKSITSNETEAVTESPIKEKPRTQ
jgi:hypothetical protein